MHRRRASTAAKLWHATAAKRASTAAKHRHARLPATRTGLSSATFRIWPLIARCRACHALPGRPSLAPSIGPSALPPLALPRLSVRAPRAVRAAPTTAGARPRTRSQASCGWVKGGRGEGGTGGSFVTFDNTCCARRGVHKMKRGMQRGWKGLMTRTDWFATAATRIGDEAPLPTHFGSRGGAPHPPPSNFEADSSVAAETTAPSTWREGVAGGS